MPNLSQTLTSRDHSVEVSAAASTLIVPANERRLWIVIVNQGANAVWLALGVAAAADTGIYLASAGGSIMLDMTSTPWYGEIRGIASAVASKVTCTEIQVKV